MPPWRQPAHNTINHHYARSAPPAGSLKPGRPDLLAEIRAAGLMVGRTLARRGLGALQQLLAEQAEQDLVLGAGVLRVQLQAGALEVLHQPAVLVAEGLADRVAEGVQA